MEASTAGIMANTLIGPPPPFDKPLGGDCPANLGTMAIKWKLCQLTVGNELFSGKYRTIWPQISKISCPYEDSYY
jgi:hypothetical protein